MQEGRAPVWFDVALLDFVRLHRAENARVAMDGLVHTLFQLQNLRGHLCFASEESTKRQLGRAADEYENVMSMVDMKVRKVTERDSLVACCPSCNVQIESPGQPNTPPSKDVIFLFMHFCLYTRAFETVLASACARSPVNLQDGQLAHDQGHANDLHTCMRW